jgi:hypothetical protein
LLNRAPFSAGTEPLQACVCLRASASDAVEPCDE